MKRKKLILMILSLSLLLTACGGSAPAKAAEEWMQAIATSDGVTALALTCDEYKPAIQEMGFFMGGMNMLTGGMLSDAEVDTSGLEFETISRDGNEAVVSISGSRFYDNNYTIDGISNNNPLDPASGTYRAADKLQGHPQIQYLNPQLIKQITVYNSNIPAEFGGFTGGQIDTQTINSTPDFWGKIHFRTTNDSWTKFHIDPLDYDDFENSNSATMQPDFKKHDFGLTINTPLNADTGLITSYQQLSSEIPLQHLDGFSTQSRKHENIFIS